MRKGHSGAEKPFLRMQKADAMRLSAHIPSSFHGNAFISQRKRSPCLFLQMQEKRTAYFDICPMTGSVRRRITINSSFPDMGVPAYRARKRAAYEERSMRQTVSADSELLAAVRKLFAGRQSGNLLFLGAAAPTRKRAASSERASPPRRAGSWKTSRPSLRKPGARWTLSFTAGPSFPT